MIQPSHINPTLSSYNKPFGTFDYNQKQISPPGCKVIVHKNPSNAKTLLIIENMYGIWHGCETDINAIESIS